MAAKGLIPLAIGLVGTIGQTVAKVGASRRQKAAAEAEAESARLVGQEEANRVRKRTKFLLGKQRAQMAAGGLALSGSPLLMLLDSAGQAELDAQSAEFSGEQKAESKKEEARIAKSRTGAHIFSGIASSASLLAQFRK